jgi:hypothetical protein
MMWITRHHESGNPSHGRNVLDYLRSRQEEFSIVSLEFGARQHTCVGFLSLTPIVESRVLRSGGIDN